MQPTQSLQAVRSSIVDTRKQGHHTDYAVSVRRSARANAEVVYRRFSAFVELQRLAMRHFENRRGTCCGGNGHCLLMDFLSPIFYATEFPSGAGLIFGKNSRPIVESRVNFLNAFLLELEDALAKCPPLVLKRSEEENCKMVALLRSFYGYMDSGANLHQSHTL